MEWDGIDLKEGFRLLEDCYNRLATAIKDEQTNPEDIVSFVDEAEHIVALLTSVMQKTPVEEESQRELMEAVKAKADGIVQLLHAEMGSIAEQYSQIKTGRQAISAYQPQPVGLGYSEGKFVDRKK